MNREKTESNHSDDLRRQVEERLNDSQNGAVDSKTADGGKAIALVHELQVHQIELEMQNEELKRAKAGADGGACRSSEKV